MKSEPVLTYAQACILAARAFADIEDGAPIPGHVSAKMVACIYQRELDQVRRDIAFIQAEKQQTV